MSHPPLPLIRPPALRPGNWSKHKGDKVRCYEVLRARTIIPMLISQHCHDSVSQYSDRRNHGYGETLPELDAEPCAVAQLGLTVKVMFFMAKTTQKKGVELN